MDWHGCLKNRSYRDLVHLLASLERRGKAVLVRDLQMELKRSAQILHVQLGKLEDEDYIHLGAEYNQPKRPSLTEKGRQAATRMGARVLGTVPAGLLRAVSDCDGIDGEGAPIFRETWDDILPPTEDFSVLVVRGDSMIGDCIAEGDEVQLQRGVKLHELEDGEIAAVMVGEDYEATLKHVHFDADAREVTLRASNPRYDDIVAPAKDVRVVGALYGVVRLSVARRNRK